MDNVANIEEVLAHEIADYASGPIEKHDTYFMQDEERRAYSWISVPHNKYERTVVVMMARVTDDNKVIIETDLADRPLYQALIDAGVPRSQIIRAYAGKTQPEP